MDAGQESTSLVNLVEVGRRFQRSVNLDRDTGSPDALSGYVVTPAVRRALSQITDGLGDAAGDRAWSLVGPYGSGKSAFAVFLADLLSPNGSAGAAAARRLLNGSGEIDLPRQPLYPAVLTAERAPLDTLLLKSLGSTLEAIWTKRRGAKPPVLKSIQRYLNGSAPALSRCATSDVVGCFEEAVRMIAEKTGAGLLLIVDEAGKALEYAAQQPTRGDVYLLQALAEVAARSNGVLFVILTVLHQSFDQYAHQLGASDRNEWAKVQGRFGELAFREGGDQIIRLTAAAIRRTGEPRPAKDWRRLVSATAAWVAEGTGWDESQVAGHLNGCWPLHPMTAALLGPLFRGRLAQNERSLFAFLSAGEPVSFRDFLRSHGPERLYTVDRLYDYATGMLGNRVLGRDGRQWAEIDTAIKRLPPESAAVDEQVLKTVGLLGMLGDQVGLRASAEIVAACVADGAAAERSLDSLKRQSALVFRQFRDAFQIWEGSGLDLDDLVLRAEGQLPTTSRRCRCSPLPNQTLSDRHNRNLAIPTMVNSYRMSSQARVALAAPGAKAPHLSTCEFCAELHGHPGVRFRDIYPDIDSRIVARYDQLVAFPTLGQLFPGSLLMVPEQHYETCADFPFRLKMSMRSFLDRLLVTIRRFGVPVFFEHGARDSTGGGCGIYHAHLHLVPLPEKVSPASLFPEHHHVAGDFLDALVHLDGCGHYLLMGDETDVRYSRVDSMATEPGSQYFRRLLVRHFGLTRSWDWREFGTPEPDVITTLASLGGSNADCR